MPLTITLTFAAAAALLNIWLALRASATRVRGKHMMGDDGDATMLARMRAHANLTEYAPFAVILCGLIELAEGPSLWLWLAVALFVLARIAHPLGMDRAAPNPFRAGGALVTWVTLALLAGWALAIAWGGASSASPRDRPGEVVFGVPRA